MTGKYFSYLSPKLENRPHAVKGDCGVFAREPIHEGELLTLWGGKFFPQMRLTTRWKISLSRFCRSKTDSI